jgi:aspartyl-tRNA(Asn)/glutamyl-tRNA(Gln) amidotransferase subunit A
MPKYASYQEFISAYQQEKITCEAMVQYYLDKIEKTKDFNIYIEVYKEDALARAKALDKEGNTDGMKGKLFGAILSIKDNICYADKQVTASSKILEGFTSTFTATAIQKLEDEGAIIIGRVNCDEFGMGSDNSHSVYGPVKNPIDPDYVPGGSSGGCAASVLADTCLASIGTDTGGSVRQPAAFCNLVGAKPSYGQISRYGIIAYASSFDQVGAISHQVSTVAKLIEVMSGHDEMDATTVQIPRLQEKLDPKRKVKIAYLAEAITSEGLDPVIKADFISLLDKLKGNGHTVDAVPFEYTDLLVPTYYVLTTAEASSNLSRYDGIRYGHRNTEAIQLEDIYKQSRTEGFGDEVKRRIMLGTFVLSASYYDAYYTKAQKVRRLIRDRMMQIFADYDFVVLPTSPVFPWKIGEYAQDPLASYLADIFTVLVNLYGGAAVSIPINNKTNSFNASFQILSVPHKEYSLFSLADLMQNKIL